MATDQDDVVRDSELGPEGGQAVERDGSASEEAVATAEETTPAQLGATKYVHAAFLAAAVLVAFLSGKILTAIWNSLGEWPAATEIAPWLHRFSEDERNSMMMIVGAVIGLLVIIQTYRKQGIRTWADEVALELSRVTWPNKDTVTNGTLVVIIASAVATVYITLLDRFWGFITNLVYST
jgi:preprotein translocase subunit SecE